MKPKIILFKSKTYSDGTHPVVIQVTIDRVAVKRVLFSINAKEWDIKNSRVKTANYNHLKFNELITIKYREIEDRILTAQIDNIPITANYLFDQKTENDTLSKLVFNYAEYLIKKEVTYFDRVQTIARSIAEYKDVAISQVDKAYFTDLYAHLRKSNSRNTVSKKIRTIYNALEYFGYGVPIRDRIKLPTDQTTKEKLTVDEFKRLKELELDGWCELARDTFMLCFYLRGMRIGDVLSLTRYDIKLDRLVIATNKSRKGMDITLHHAAVDIINKYDDPVYLLPIVKRKPLELSANPDLVKSYKKHIESKTAIINKNLKLVAIMALIDKSLTTHVARHTFAHLASNSGLNIFMIKDLLTHSNIQTTQNYIDELNNTEKLNKASNDFLKDF